MSIQHKDIPDAQLHEAKGAAGASIGQILTATGTGTATFQTAPYTKTKMGWWDYNDTATTTTPIALTSANVEYQLTNNGLGGNTNVAYALPSIPNIWNTATNYFQFSGLQLGDTLDVRIDIEVTTGSTNNNVDVIMEFGIGSTPYKLTIDRRFLKNNGVNSIVANAHIYIGNNLTLNNPARILVKNDTVGSTCKVNGWFIRALTNG